MHSCELPGWQADSHDEPAPPSPPPRRWAQQTSPPVQLPAVQAKEAPMQADWVVQVAQQVVARHGSPPGAGGAVSRSSPARTVFFVCLGQAT
jgi:hypothetical protein